MASCSLVLFVTKGTLCMHTSWRVSRVPVYAGIHQGTIVYAYHIEGPMQGICLKVIVPIEEQWL